MRKPQNFQWKEMTMGTCYYPEHWSRELWQDDLQRMKAAGTKPSQSRLAPCQLPRRGELKGCFPPDERAPPSGELARNEVTRLRGFDVPQERKAP